MVYVVISFLCAGLAGAAGRALGWLARDGAVAAAFVGGTIFAFLGWRGALVLVFFFVSSSLLTHLNRIKAGAYGVEHGREALESRRGRSARQVLANGSAASLAAIWALLASGNSIAPGAFGGVWHPEAGTLLPRLAFAGALAAAAADTWATEIGTFAHGIPRSPLTGRVMEPGESGGMTVFGTFGGLVGAAAIGQLAAWLWPDFGARQAVGIEVAGFAGMWLDSVLGAGLQYKAACPACGRIVEDPGHPHQVLRPRGLRFVDNDVVNLVATFAGGVLAVLAGR